MQGLVSNIQRYSVNDGPGIRTTVFLKGCPLACKWCHNPESISPERQLMLREDRCIGCGECMLVCGGQAISRDRGRPVTDRRKCLRCGRCTEVCHAEARSLVGREMSTEEVIAEVSKDKVFYAPSGGGVTFSGGEPFLQSEFLLSLLKAAGAGNVHTAVDTSGYASPALLDEASELVDLFLYDIKAIDDTRHRGFTGVSNGLILENLRRLVARQNQVVVRVPIIPAVNDDPAEILKIGVFVASLGGIGEIHVLPYHESGVDKYRRLGQEYGMEYAGQPSAESLGLIAAELTKYVPRVVIGG